MFHLRKMESVKSVVHTHICMWRGQARAGQGLLIFTVLEHLHQPQFPEALSAWLTVALELQTQGERAVTLIWFLVAFSWMRNCLLRALQGGFCRLKTVTTDSVGIRFRTWGNSLPSAAIYIHHIFSVSGPEFRMLFPLLKTAEGW